MTEILLRCLILFLITMAICCTFWEGMIFESLGNAIEETVGEKWAKPLGQCYVCTSFWVALVGSIILGWQWYLCFITLGIAATLHTLKD